MRVAFNPIDLITFSTRDLEAHNTYDTLERGSIIFYLYKQTDNFNKKREDLPRKNVLHRALIFTRRRYDNVDRGDRDKNSIIDRSCCDLVRTGA